MNVAVNQGTPKPTYESEEAGLDDESVPTPRIVTLNVHEALLAVVTVPLSDATPLAKLTPVERHVARLAAEGLSNAEIGRRRGTAERTVANQMASILRKLRVGSRYELAAQLSRCALDRGNP